MPNPIATYTVDQLKGISASITIAEAKTHLEVALAPYAIQIGKPVDALDYEHLQIAKLLLQLLLEANRG